MIEPKIKQDVYSGATIKAPRDDTAKIIGEQAKAQNKLYTQLGEFVQGQGEAIVKKAEKWQESIDLGKVSAAEAAFQKSLIDYENQLKARQGWAAKGAGEDFQNWFQKTQAELEKSILENDVQKKAFREFVQKKFPVYYSRVKAHETSEVLKATDDSIEAGIVAQIETATANPTDLQMVDNGVHEIQRRVTAQAIHNGWDENTAKLKMQEYTSKLHSTNFDQLVQASPLKAEDYLKRYGTQMTADDYVRATTVLLEQKRKMTAKAVVDMTMAAVEPMLRQDPAMRLKYFAAKHAGSEAMPFDAAMKTFNHDISKAVLAVKYGADKVKTWGNEIPKEAEQYLQQVMKDFQSGKPIDTPALSDLINEIKKRITDPEAQDMAIKELKMRYNTAKKARDEQINTNFEQAIGQLNQNGYRVSEIDPALLALLPPSYRKKLKDYADKMGEIEPNWNVYADLRDMADFKPKEFMQYDLRKHFGELSKSQLEQLMDIQSKLRAASGLGANKVGGQKGLKPVATLNQAIANFAAANDITEKDKLAKFKLIAYDALSAAQKRKGEPLTYDEIQKELLRLTSPVRVDTWYGYSTVKYWEALLDDNNIVSFQVPDEIRAQIIHSFKQRGIDPSPEQIKAVYMRMIGKQ